MKKLLSPVTLIAVWLPLLPHWRRLLLDSFADMTPGLMAVFGAGLLPLRHINNVVADTKDVDRLNTAC